MATSNTQNFFFKLGRDMLTDTHTDKQTDTLITILCSLTEDGVININFNSTSVWYIYFQFKFNLNLTNNC